MEIKIKVSRGQLSFLGRALLNQSYDLSKEIDSCQENNMQETLKYFKAQKIELDKLYRAFILESEII